MSDTEDLEEEVTEAWVRIQKDTFANWINDKLRTSHGDVNVQNLKLDLRDGVILCKLMGELKGAKIGRFTEKANLNHYQAVANVQMAIRAMEQDDITMVNIGAEDISAGNLKLILGMCWLLIRRYQIGARSRLPTKKIMLAWINAVLHPDEVTNFSADWNDGVALHRVIEYCRPGSAPHWESLNHMDRVENCDVALGLAERLFGIPRVVRSENMASGDLDELSGMTYLSYFTAVGGPGYNATLQWVNDTLHPDHVVDDFTTSWTSGDVLADLVQKLGCDLPDLSSAKPDGKCRTALASSQKQFGIPAFISARDVTSQNADHIALMAHVAWLRVLSGHSPAPAPGRRDPSPVAEYPSPTPSPTPSPEPEPYVAEMVLDEPKRAPPYMVPILTDIRGNSAVLQQPQQQQQQHSYSPDPEVIQGTAHPAGYEEDSETEEENSQYQDPEQEEEEEVPPIHNGYHHDDVALMFGLLHVVDIYGRGLLWRNNDVTPVMSNGDEEDDGVTVTIQSEWAVDNPVTFHIKTTETEEQKFTAHVTSPSHNESPLPVLRTGSSVYDATFTPFEKGTWEIRVMNADGDEVSKSPFHLECYDVTQAEIIRDDEGPIAVREPYEFHVTTAEVNNDKVRVHVLHENESLPAEVVPGGSHVFKVTFTPPDVGTCRVSVYIGGAQVPGSPFSLGVEDLGAVHVFGQGLHSGRQQHAATFQIDATANRNKRLDISIMGPNHLSVPTETRTTSDGCLSTVTYTPPVQGTYKIEVMYNRLPVAGSPFYPEISHACVYVNELREEAVVGESSTFIVDATEMGKGMLEIDSDLPMLSYQKEADKKYRVTFIPKKVGKHDLVIKYNNLTVAASPYVVNVRKR